MKSKWNSNYFKKNTSGLFLGKQIPVDRYRGIEFIAEQDDKGIDLQP